ncbi:MAG: phosphoglycerate kinase [Bacteroidales bacterium]|jgi:phosphoglycerate kinase|nr:phosphoglycerate kinase [Bacteroidales bacterium]
MCPKAEIKTYDFKGKKALVRVDYNVPLNDEFQIQDTKRIDASLPTLKKILDDGGSIILMSHLGRPKNKEYQFSLQHLIPYLENVLPGVNIYFAPECIGEQTRKIANALRPREILLLENVRFFPEEEAGDEQFAKELASYGDVFVHEAFSTAHRNHATTAVIADFFPNDKMYGFLMAAEIENLSQVMNNPRRPVTAVLGGAKISSKIQVITNLIKKVDNLLIGGAMDSTFHKYLGGNIGNTLYEEDMQDVAKQILATAKENHVNIYLAPDKIAADKFANDAKRGIYDSKEIPDGWAGLDIGPDTCTLYRDVILKSSTILWNGPMGVFEMENFSTGTFMVAEAIAKATRHGAFSLVGGGDSVAAINKFHLTDNYTYVSTAGGAMLEYCEGKILPGIRAIEK